LQKKNIYLKPNFYMTTGLYRLWLLKLKDISLATWGRKKLGVRLKCLMALKQRYKDEQPLVLVMRVVLHMTFLGIDETLIAMGAEVTWSSTIFFLHKIKQQRLMLRQIQVYGRFK
jgi:S-adenosylhomocysteine hydrolase